MVEYCSVESAVLVYAKGKFSFFLDDIFSPVGSTVESVPIKMRHVSWILPKYRTSSI